MQLYTLLFPCFSSLSLTHTHTLRVNPALSIILTSTRQVFSPKNWCCLRYSHGTGKKGIVYEWKIKWTPIFSIVWIPAICYIKYWHCITLVPAPSMGRLKRTPVMEIQDYEAIFSLCICNMKLFQLSTRIIKFLEGFFFFKKADASSWNLIGQCFNLEDTWHLSTA